MKADSHDSAHAPIMLRLHLPDASWDNVELCCYTSRRKRVHSDEWTVGRLRKCTERKIDDMERKEVGLRRFLLVQSCMAAVVNEPLEMPVDEVGTPIDDDDMQREQLFTECAVKKEPIRCSSPVLPKRRPSVHSRSGTTNHNKRVSDAPKKLDSRPPKKRRLKCLLKDTGRLAVLAASGSCCAGRVSS